jgi:hypothetical protein
MVLGDVVPESAFKEAVQADVAEGLLRRAVDVPDL